MQSETQVNCSSSPTQKHGRDLFLTSRPRALPAHVASAMLPYAARLRGASLKALTNLSHAASQQALEELYIHTLH